MKKKILVAILALGMQLTALVAPKNAEAGLLGMAIFGSGAIKADPNAVGLKTDLWLLTAASAGVTYGGVALIRGVGGIVGTILGVVVVILDEPNTLKAGSIEETLLLSYPEIDDREWLAELAQAAKESSTLIPDTRIDAIPGAQIIEVKMNERVFNSMIRQTALTQKTIARLRADLL